MFFSTARAWSRGLAKKKAKRRRDRRDLAQAVVLMSLGRAAFPLASHHSAQAEFVGMAGDSNVDSGSFGWFLVARTWRASPMAVQGVSHLMLEQY